MNFISAIKSALTQYYQFSGRASRSEFWWFFLFTIIFELLIAFTLGGVYSIVASGALILPNFAIIVRRLHDSNKTGYWLMAPILPMIVISGLMSLFSASPSFIAQYVSILKVVVIIYYVYLYSIKGDEYHNKYGPNPLKSTANSK